MKSKFKRGDIVVLGDTRRTWDGDEEPEFICGELGIVFKYSEDSCDVYFVYHRVSDIEDIDFWRVHESAMEKIDHIDEKDWSNLELHKVRVSI